MQYFNPIMIFFARRLFKEDNFDWQLNIKLTLPKDQCIDFKRLLFHEKYYLSVM